MKRLFMHLLLLPLLVQNTKFNNIKKQIISTITLIHQLNASRTQRNKSNSNGDENYPKTIEHNRQGIQVYSKKDHDWISFAYQVIQNKIEHAPTKFDSFVKPSIEPHITDKECQCDYKNLFKKDLHEKLMEGNHPAQASYIVQDAQCQIYETNKLRRNVACNTIKIYKKSNFFTQRQIKESMHISSVSGIPIRNKFDALKDLDEQLQVYS
eukprot:TRINITY_DN20516_c0_g1_i1.p1 TRINITY_DN20516_c0_g1~~TRINITY_DN20516_c0_g1_i1.p1  ORF type:complete len:218 (+),score=0.18 TRINITY_DN20516_c0_g1_i1:25-654(+)